LIVQSIRFAVSGVLPNAEGEEKPQVKHPLGCVLALYLIGLLCAVMACALVVALAKRAGHRQVETDEEADSDDALAEKAGRHGGKTLEEAEQEDFEERMIEMALNGAAMTFAWSVLWATRWAFAWAFDPKHPELPHPSQVMQRIVIALLLSALACASVFVLDKIDDVSKDAGIESEAQAKAIQILVNSLAILIGFSWEHSFDGGVAAVASLSQDPRRRPCVKFAMGLAIATVVTPMWRKHILTKELALEQLKRDREAALDARMKKEVDVRQPLRVSRLDWASTGAF